jgi:hypothetical protein
LTLWYDATVGVTQSGGTVSAWADQSPSGFNTDHVSATKPTYVASAQNGLPGVQFVAGSSTYLSRESNSACFTTAFTMGFVVKLGAAINSWLFSHGVGNAAGIGLESDGNAHWRVQMQGVSGDPDRGLADQSAFHIITFKTSNTVTYPNFRIDGVEVSGQGVQSPAWNQPDQTGSVGTWVAEIVLGAQDSVDNHVYGSFSDCTHCEIFIIDHWITDADLHAIEVSLGTKWGIRVT